MKLALIVPGGVDRGGTHRVVPFLLWLLERLTKHHDVHVFALRQESRPASWSLGRARIHNIGARPRRLRALAALRREHGRAPFDLIHAHWAVPQGPVGAAARLLLHRPLVLGLAGGELVSLPELGFGGRHTAQGRAWIRLSLAAADRIVVPGRAMARAAERLGHQAAVVPLGVALDRWPPRPPRQRDPGTPARLLHVADLRPIKDQHTLLRAAALLAQRGEQFELHIAGTDTMDGRVQRAASASGLGDRVHFHGFLPHRHLRPLVERSDVLVISSRFEAGPVALLEAAAAGVPTVGTDVGYVRDWAPDAAVAVAAGNAEALAAALTDVLNNEDARLRLAHSAHARALEQDADAMAAGWLDIYDETVRSYASARAITDLDAAPLPTDEATDEDFADERPPGP